MLTLALILTFTLALTPFLLLAFAYVTHRRRRMPVTPLYSVTQVLCWLHVCTHEYCVREREKRRYGVVVMEWKRDMKVEDEKREDAA